MNENAYPFTLWRTEYRYEFVSIRAKNEVRKIVQKKLDEMNEMLNNIYLSTIRKRSITKQD